jgi:hypothetical protein
LQARPGRLLGVVTRRGISGRIDRKSAAKSRLDALLTIILVVLTIMCLMAAGAFYTMKPAKVAAIETGYLAAAAVLLFLVQALL